MLAASSGVGESEPSMNADTRATRRKHRLRHRMPELLRRWFTRLLASALAIVRVAVRLPRRICAFERQDVGIYGSDQETLV